MVFAKIPRHTSQNAITEGDLKCILTRNCEGTEQLHFEKNILRSLLLLHWLRRWRDLNSRAGCPTYRISSADPSATWVHLHGVTNQQIRYSLYFLVFLPSIPVFAAS